MKDIGEFSCINPECPDYGKRDMEISWFNRHMGGIIPFACFSVKLVANGSLNGVILPFQEVVSLWKRPSASWST